MDVDTLIDRQRFCWTVWITICCEKLQARKKLQDHSWEAAVSAAISRWQCTWDSCTVKQRLHSQQNLQSKEKSLSHHSRKQRPNQQRFCLEAAKNRARNQFTLILRLLSYVPTFHDFLNLNWLTIWMTEMKYDSQSVWQWHRQSPLPFQRVCTA